MKKVSNSFQLVFPALSENERFCRQCVTAFVSPMNPTVEELSDLRTAVSEAVTNCIVHAYREIGEQGRITVTGKRFADGRIVIRVRDKGCGMADVDLCRQPLYTSDPCGERGGMGFPIMESFCDAVKVASAVGRGTTVTLTKRFSHDR